MTRKLFIFVFALSESSRKINNLKGIEVLLLWTKMFRIRRSLTSRILDVCRLGFFPRNNFNLIISWSNRITYTFCLGTRIFLYRAWPGNWENVHHHLEVLFDCHARITRILLLFALLTLNNCYIAKVETNILEDLERLAFISLECLIVVRLHALIDLDFRRPGMLILVSFLDYHVDVEFFMAWVSLSGTSFIITFHEFSRINDSLIFCF